jgi:hypothetical protein
MPVKISNWREPGRIPTPFNPNEGAKIMKIRMLTTAKGSPDGINIYEYEAGKKYDISEHLGNIFLDADMAEQDKVETIEVKDEIKSNASPAKGTRKPRRGKKSSKG